MHTYVISYDLKSEHSDKYDELYEAIKSLSENWTHYLDSTWIVKSKYPSADEIYTKLERLFERGDSCIVIEVVNNKQGWLTDKQWNYLDNNIFN